MHAALIFLAIGVLGLGAIAAWQRSQRMALEREREVRGFVFPSGLLQKFHDKHPDLSPKEVQLTAQALRQFFLVLLRAHRQPVAMPSKAADTLWHAFSLETHAYAAFCKAAFGTNLHHKPARGMGSASGDPQTTWRTWQLACLEENIDPAKASRLPLLYALDAKLRFPGAVTHDPSDFKPPRDADGSSSGSDNSSSNDRSSCGDGDGGGDGGGGGGD